VAQGQGTRRTRSIFFPWESQGGWRRFLAITHIGPAAVLIGLVLFVWTVAERERHALAERRTLVGLSRVKRAVLRYVVDHGGQCPASLALVSAGKEPGAPGAVPRDGWGRPFRIVCGPSISDEDYVIMSDGPDGEPGGLDRIEY
jgi:general secretion pathway protein G